MPRPGGARRRTARATGCNRQRIVGNDSSRAKPQRLSLARSKKILAETIEKRIVPQLIASLRATSRRPSEAARIDSAALRVSAAELATLVLARESAPAVEHVRSLRARGLPVERVLVEVLAAAARRLGELWVADRCTFTEVTLGLGRLQYLLHELGVADRAALTASRRPRRAHISAAPGDDHGFGASMVAECLRRDGWFVDDEPPARWTDLVVAVRDIHYDVVGVSFNVDFEVEPVRDAIAAMRAASLNRELVIMVGGCVFDRRPGLVERVGADATAPDATLAALEAATRVHLAARRLGA